MKERNLHLGLALVAALGMAACNVIVSGGPGETIFGSGVATEQSRSLAGITSVELAMPGTLTIQIGSSESLQIEAEDNLLEYIQTDITSSRLVIEIREGINLISTRPINFNLTVTRLEAILDSSSGDIVAPDLETDHFSTTLSSSGSLSMGDLICTTFQVELDSSGSLIMGELSAETITVHISSSGSLEIAGGEVREQEITLSSSGAYLAREMESTEAGLDLSSSGSATIRVSGHLRATLTSSGNVYYIGNPSIDESTSSSGRVEQLSE